MDQANQQETPAPPLARAVVFSVHILTGLGAGLALLALLEAVREHWAAMFGWLGLALMALLVGAQNPVVSGVEGSLTSSLVEERRLGAAFGFLNGINGAADLVSSVTAGALWTLVSPVAALGFGAVLCAAAAAILWLRAPIKGSRRTQGEA